MMKSIPQSDSNSIDHIHFSKSATTHWPKGGHRHQSHPVPHLASSFPDQAFSTFTSSSLSISASRSMSSTSLVLPSLPLPSPQPGAAVSENTNTGAIGGVGVNKAENSNSESGSAASDLVQHCLLFPTYATRHSRSGSKDPLDWNIRVRGWAFSKRSNRRKRLVMSIARKIAGVTKDDDKVYETLESRFGMFLASNTQGAQFTVQCVGLASTTHMELAEDTGSDHPTVDVLRDELNTTDGALALEEVIQDKELLRKSLEQDKGDLLNTLALVRELEEEAKRTVVPLQHAAVTALKSLAPERIKREEEEQLAEQRKQDEDAKQTRRLQSSSVMEELESKTLDLEPTEEQPKYTPGSEIPLSQLTSTEGESSFAGRLSKSAALLKGAIKKYTPSGMSHANGNTSAESLKIHRHQSELSTRTNSSISNMSGDISVRSGNDHRAGSGDSVLTQAQAQTQTQTQTQYEDLGMGCFPTIKTSSRPGGHFVGTLRMSLEEVETHRKKDTEGGHPRFLKLHAHHQEMGGPTHGIVNLIDPKGISIISDIDDTIKETNVTAGTRIILRNTFLKDMQEVEGMANVYRKWWNQGAAVHYVSNSPWQLIPSLLEFFQRHMFPPGSAHLRLHDSMFKTYFAVPGENKRRAIKEILEDFPDRKFILVGDSGEIDMEIYTDIAVAYPSQIFRIFIRDISTERLTLIVSKTPQVRSRSFSSLLLNKAPVTAVTTGFGLFHRRESGFNTPGNVYNGIPSPSLNPSAMSTMDMGEEDEADIDFPTTSSPMEFPEEGMVAKAEMVQVIHLEGQEAHDHRYGGSFSPKLDPSGPFSEPIAVPLSRSPASPGSQSKPITMSIKSMTSSFLNSTFRRSPPNSPSTINFGDNGQKNSHGWGATKLRAGTMQPKSSLTAGLRAASSQGFPFPKVAPATSSSSAVSVSHQSSSFSCDDLKEQDVDLAGPLPDKDIFEDHDHRHVVLQQLQHHQTDNHPRMSTFTYSSSPSLRSTPAITPYSGLTPAHSPTVSPKVPIRGFRELGGGMASGNISTITLATDSTSALSTTMTSTSSGIASIQIPLSTSPSISHSMTSSSSSFSTTKNPLEIWRERVEKCKERLPKGVILTLFKNADDLEQCQAVREMFLQYEKGAQDGSNSVAAMTPSASSSSLDSSSSPSRGDSVSSVEENDSCFIRDEQCSA